MSAFLFSAARLPKRVLLCVEYCAFLRWKEPFLAIFVGRYSLRMVGWFLISIMPSGDAPTRRVRSSFQIPSATKESLSYTVCEPSHDIDSSIRFSRVRFLFTLVGLLLACSDVARAGLGTRRLDSVMDPYTAESGIYFGPYGYPITQIIKTKAATGGYEFSPGDSSPASTRVWSYKYDSLSIALRALVNTLGIRSSWPRCLLYLESCATDHLSLQTTFEMMDPLVSAIQNQWFANQKAGVAPKPIVFLANSYWVDRMHHFFLALMGSRRTEARHTSVHYYQLPFNDANVDVCDPMTPRVQRPFVCDLAIPWEFPGDSGQVRLANDLWSRLAVLQNKYPHLHFDLTMISSINVRSNVDDAMPLRWSYYRGDISEVSTLIRGRSCSVVNSLSDSQCVTEVYDEFRYERTTLVTDVDQWYNITSTLRAMSQFYVFVRVAALWLGCYKARAGEFKWANFSFYQRFFCVWGTFFRIPGHVIVYSSWLPVVGYAMAHLIDSALVHLHSDVLGSTINGNATFEFWPSLNAASVQMRNIWSIAMMAKSFSLLQIHAFPSTWRRRHGLVCVRGTWIGWLAAITIVAPFRILALRNSDVLNVQFLPLESILPHAHLPMQCDYVSEFGIRLDIKMVVEAMIVTFLLVVTIKCCLWGCCQFLAIWCTNPDIIRAASCFATNFGFARTYYLPYSFGTLFDGSCMSVYWSMTLADSYRSSRSFPNSRKTSITPIVVSSSAPTAARSKQENCRSCLYQKNHWGWIASQGCTDHDGMYHVQERSTAIWSAVRLINVAMLTDPLVWLRLYVCSQPLYLYDMSNSDSGLGVESYSKTSSTSVRIILPCCPKQLTQELGQLHTLCGFKLVDLVDSAFVPWTLLLQCG